MLEELEALVTGRSTSMLVPDMERNDAALRDAFQRRRIAVIGAAGSVGSAVVKQLVRYDPSSLALFDLSENNLTELVRDLRSTPGIRVPSDFVTLPIGLGSGELQRYCHESPPFEIVFNLSAIKHVRSEKNVYSLIRMLDTNVVHPHDFLSSLPYRLERFFSVSSDKATNPANLMGASKMVMEEVLLLHSARHPVSSARFANVSFSDGSLPFGFLRRMEKAQPLSAPQDVRRYFISHEEAGQLCILSAALGQNRDIFYPKLESSHHAITFSEIALRLLRKRGFEPVVCATEEEAKNSASKLIPARKWPCHFFNSDTTGEKDLEEFYTTGDDRDLERFNGIGVIRGQLRDAKISPLPVFLEFVRRLKTDSTVTKADIVSAFLKIVPGMAHVETGKNLDQKM